MNIGEASRASGVNSKMIRYYESIGLLEDVGRSANGYRTYNQNDVHTLAFIRRARCLGFSIDQIQTLMELWRDKDRSSAEVKAIAQGQIAELQAKIEELAPMQRTLEHMVACCAGDNRPDCPITDDLSAKVAAPAKPKHTRSNGARQPVQPPA